MQNSILNIAKELEGEDLVDSQLSFRGFIQFLKERKLRETTMKVKYLDFVINHFEQRLAGKDLIRMEEMKQYDDLLQLVYATIFPAIGDERESLWALSLPLKPVMFYGTDLFYDLLRDEATGDIKACMIDKQDKERNAINVELIYSTILKKCYNYSYHAPGTLIRSLFNRETHMANFYKLNIDTRFIQVFPKGPAPEFDRAALQPHLADGTAIGYLQEVLPMELFRFQGIAAITVEDITSDYVVETIKNIILNPSACDVNFHYENVIRSLKILSGRNDVDFGMFPFLKVNNRPVFMDQMCSNSLLGAATNRYGDAESAYLSMAEKYSGDPKPIFFETIPASAGEKDFFLKKLLSNGVKSYALIPVFNNNHLAGVVEVSSPKEGVLDQALLSGLNIVLPLVAQLLQRSTDEFDAEIKDIIKENFTSIQPAVEWRFNDVAWHYLQEQHWGDKRAGLETIYFKNIFPLYGAIDIRNSTIERNSALRRDLQTQFNLLVHTLSELQRATSLELLDELIFQCRKWEDTLSGTLTTAEELDLHTFLRDKVQHFFTHFQESSADTAAIIEPYLEAVNELTGSAFKQRRELEESIRLINRSINTHLEDAADELQKSYPSYFEKFRTDGVEYDIYVGQSIAPDKPFDEIYLRNLRLWQLNSMAIIASLTNSLLPQMPEKLQTTQLIFVHSNSIDISFRKDERRFDVEGGYNIRYQVVKKRIDKVHIKGGNERLTQPGKIAIIYFNDKEAEEYRGYIKYLQGKNVLDEDLEILDLEELQGVSGLRAFRIGVRLN